MTNTIEIITPLKNQAFMESWYELSDADHFWFQWRLKAVLQQLNDSKIVTDKDWLILDVGCGTGVLRNQIEDSTNWTVDATDLDYAALKHAKSGRGRTMYYDINEKQNELKEKYDAILLFDVIEHIEDTQTFIQSLMFHLKPNGYLIVNVPALQSLYSLYDKVQGHYRRYNKQSIQNEFKNFSLEIKDTRYWGMTNTPIIWLRKYWLIFFSKNKSNEEIFQEGFKPPGNIIRSVFLGLMKAETTLTSSPPLGSSVLMLLRKKDQETK